MSLVSSLQELLSQLRAIQWHAWTSHWMARGPEFYSDHLLLQRIYESPEEGGVDINAQIDKLGERMVSAFGGASIPAGQIEHRAADLVEQAISRNQNDVFGAALDLEKQIQSQVARILKDLGASEVVWDNFLRTLADERSEVYYLIQRRSARPNKLQLVPYGRVNPIRGSTDYRWVGWAALAVTLLLYRYGWPEEA